MRTRVLNCDLEMGREQFQGPSWIQRVQRRPPVYLALYVAPPGVSVHWEHAFRRILPA